MYTRSLSFTIKGMEWLGHVARTEDFILPRKIIKSRRIKAGIWKTSIKMV